jgi:transposase
VVRQKTATLLALKNLIARNTGRMVSASELKRLQQGEYPEEIQDPHIRRAIDGTVHVFQVLEEECAALQATVKAAGLERPGYRNLRTVKGIGELLALTILYETGDIRRFPKVGNYASYCRCVRTTHESNGRRKGEGNRRNGNPYLSWAFSEAAHFVIRYQPAARRYFDRKKKATNGIVAMRAIAHKLSRAVYFMLRDDVSYRPELLFGASS